MRLISIDPSIRNTGYAVLQQLPRTKPSALKYGVIHNIAALEQSKCLVAIHNQVRALIEEYEPDACAMEGVIFVQSRLTAIQLGAARGAAILACAQRGLPVYEYAPKRVKQAVVGTGSAQKEQVAFMVRALLGLTETPPHDAADALAIGLTHFQLAAVPAQVSSARRLL